MKRPSKGTDRKEKEGKERKRGIKKLGGWVPSPSGHEKVPLAAKGKIE